MSSFGGYLRGWAQSLTVRTALTLSDARQAEAGTASWWPAGRRVQRALLAAALMISGGIAIANQVNTSTSGVGPVVKTYPSTLTASYAVTGLNTAIFEPSVALNAFGAVTSAQLSPAISATTDAIRLRITTPGCTLAAVRCADRGTMTITFNRPVTNPVLHISGLGGSVTGGGTNSFFAASLLLTGATGPTTSPTLTSLNGSSNFQVSGGNEIRVATVNGAVNCNVTPTGGCGSVRVNGTVTSLTFRTDLLLAGTTDPGATGAESLTITTSVDEDYGDAPSGFQAAPVASHIVGGLYLGSSVTADNVATTNPGTLGTSPVANATASGDGGDDGVTFPTLVRGVASSINVVVTGTGGRLQGWIDWGNDGSFSTAGDRVATDAIDGGAGDGDGVANGIIRVAVTPPTGTTQVTVNARFRISSTAGLGINGLAPDGEVEDYQVIVYPQRADLSLAKTVSNAAPTIGASVNYVLTVTSATSPASTATATGITVQDTLPAGITFVSASGTGTYNSTSGVWSVGSLAPGGSASITLTGTVTAGSGTVTNVAQISASSLPDPDSTVNNGVTTEDDYASVPFTVAAVPILAAPVCPSGGTQQRIVNGDFSTGTGPNWANWTASPVWIGTGEAVAENDTTTGTLTQSGLTGLKFGPGPGNGTVIQLTQFWRNGAPALGSNAAQLTISLAGTPYARLTTAASDGTVGTIEYLNGASGNIATIGEFAYTGWRINVPNTVAATGALAFTHSPGGGTSDDFRVDNVTLYTCDPGQLTVDKSSVLVSDPSNGTTNPKAIPGAIIRYCILVTNPSTATAANIVMADTLPANVTFVPGSMRTGTSCASAATVEDDNNAGADESDTAGMAFATGAVSGQQTTLAAGTAAAFVFNAAVN